EGFVSASSKKCARPSQVCRTSAVLSGEPPTRSSGRLSRRCSRKPQSHLRSTSVLPLHILRSRGGARANPFLLLTTRLIDALSRPRGSRRATIRSRPLVVAGLEERVMPSNFTEVEPNNSQATANLVTIATGDILTTAPSNWLTITGSVGSNADVDYF